MAGCVVLVFDESATMNTPMARPSNLPAGMDAPVKSKALTTTRALVAKLNFRLVAEIPGSILPPDDDEHVFLFILILIFKPIF